jgi:hypothetical protein
VLYAAVGGMLKILYHLHVKIVLPLFKSCVVPFQTDCYEQRTFQIDLCFHHKPLASFKGMMDVLPNVVVAVSQYPLPEKDFIVSLVTALGGK